MVRIIEIAYVLYLAAVYAFYIFGWIFNFKKADVLDIFILTVSGYCAAASASLGYARFRVAFFGLILVGAFLLWKGRSPLSVFKKRDNSKKAGKAA